MTLLSKDQFIKNLEFLMKQKNIKPSELEKRADISQGYISRLKTNPNYPNIEVLFSFADTLGVTVDVLLSLDFNVASKDTVYLIYFLQELLSRTENESVMWRKISKTKTLPLDDSEKISSVFREEFDSNGDWVKDVYTSIFIDCPCELNKDIIVLDRDLQTFYLMPIVLRNNERTIDSFELYVNRNGTLKAICFGNQEENSELYDLLCSIYSTADNVIKKIHLDDTTKGALDDFIKENDMIKNLF